MSLLHAVDDAVKMCKVEESRLTDTIRQCKEILHSMRTRKTDNSELETVADRSEKDDILPEEKQEIELLEQVLKKALRIRSTSEAHKEMSSDSNLKTLPNKSINKALINDVKHEDKRKPVKTVSSSEMCRNPNQQRRADGRDVTRGALWTRPVLVRKGPSAHPVVKGKSVPKSAPVKISSTGSQQKISVKATNAKELSEDYSTSISYQQPCKEMCALGKDIKSTTETLAFNEQWILSPLLPVWRAQRAKQNRLWSKVITQQSKPVPERTRFTERLHTTFPSEWPSGFQADITTDLDALTQRCLDLIHCLHTELQTQETNQSCLADSEPGTLGKRQYESSLMLEGLERMTTELLTCAGHHKKEWEKWNKCRPGALCPIRRRGEWGNSCLPPILCYTTETELRELESRRLRVEQLQQAIHLQQAMSDYHASYWTSPDSGTERPSAVALRSLYSLLAEGGVQFPSLVLDSE
ncbi:uncharacterized protein LOC127449751 isoform X1 [Myxocyprinus asiaticus]|uniref:uncharacterized protein LOC127449751 isoform X1 n=1 Tax=Myxocyprinus asiaticus TaxID=70543 RepID=UPI00222172D9|nr:uncharacterized protein LOC127449751 isoform X1 [Myxocyprinus asiaticus]XP_051569235.1 uncharacterized protein LOC127449751 isoform X1 [Myxocyprinus asiaticus]